MNRFKKQRMKKSGFTLVELMIVIAIVAILVALALPNYNESVRKARRSDAQQVLMGLAGRAERIFTQTNDYEDSDTLANEVDDADDTSEFYNYAVDFPEDGEFLLTAGPKGAQSTDKCGAMSLSNTGARAHKVDEDFVPGWCD